MNSFLLLLTFLKLPENSGLCQLSFIKVVCTPQQGDCRSLAASVHCKICNLTHAISHLGHLDFSFSLVLRWRIQCATMIRAWKHNSQPHSESISPPLSQLFSPHLFSQHVPWTLLGARWDLLSGPHAGSCYLIGIYIYIWLILGVAEAE